MHRWGHSWVREDDVQCVLVFVPAYMYLHVCVYLCIHVYMYVCLCTYIVVAKGVGCYVRIYVLCRHTEWTLTSLGSQPLSCKRVSA